MTPQDIDGGAPGPPRRVVVRAAAITGLAAALAGCETYGRGPAGATSTAVDQSPAAEGSAASGGEKTALATTGEIPVGGGKVFDGENVVVTQPVGGEFVAFSAVCTHQGCTVAAVNNGTINCPCHGSQFRIADGSVAGGPAPRPLSKVQITVDGSTIRLA